MTEFRLSPVAASIPFDNSGNGFTATTLQDAIEEIGLGGSSPGFSWNRVVGLVLVELNRQMLVYQDIEITNGAELDIQGEVAIIL